MFFAYSFVYMRKMFCKNGTMLYKVGDELMPNTPLNVLDILDNSKK